MSSWSSIRRLSKLKFSPKIIVFLSLLFVGWMVIYVLTGKRKRPENVLPSDEDRHDGPEQDKVRTQVAKPTTQHPFLKGRKQTGLPCDNVHIFYYPWYGNPEHDGKYLHWNHHYIPDWHDNTKPKKEPVRHKPPGDVASDFYPSLGPYSSRDPSVIKDHMSQVRSSRAGVVVVSYYPVGRGDDEGKDWSAIYPLLFDAAQEAGLKVALHIEPYKGRDEDSVKNDLAWMVKTYGDHPALYRSARPSDLGGKQLPMVYIYDSYHTKPEQWAKIFDSNSAGTIRGTELDCVAIALLVEANHRDYVTVGHFDGLYTYFASKGFTYGSSWSMWIQITKFAAETKTYFIPSVGPGYTDISVRVWNAQNSKMRDHGQYYKDAWDTAIDSAPSHIAITSFNEWHEGTQIEKAVPMKSDARRYYDYSPFEPSYYLGLSAAKVNEYARCSS